MKGDPPRVGRPQGQKASRRVVKTTGDGLLIEFQSIIDAVRCAVDAQRAMAERDPLRSPEEGWIRQHSTVGLVSGISVHTSAVAISPTAARLRKAAPTPKSSATSPASAVLNVAPPPMASPTSPSEVV